jgi:hypothetical protein
MSDWKPRVVTLCGSTRFREEYEAANRRLTLEGVIVISVGLFGHQEPEAMSEGTKAGLDELHLRKIDLSDGIYVINPGGYIGASTRREIGYAKRTGKEVAYLEDAARDDAPEERLAEAPEGP